MPLRFRIQPLPPANQPPGEINPVLASAVAASGERVFELTSDPAEVRLGRQPSFELELPFPAVSVFHARLFRGESVHEWWLEDQGSTNGTWLDGQRLAPRRPVLIRSGQRMRVGSVEIVFEGWAPTVKGGQSTATIARRLIGDLFGAADNDAAVLALEAGPAAPALLRLAERERRYLVGRAETCDVVIAGDQASREHAAFERRWDGVFVSDLGSRNGVLVNGVAVVGAQRLRDGDSVQLGGVTFKLTDAEDRYLQQLDERLGDGGPQPNVDLPDPRPEAEATARAATQPLAARDEPQMATVLTPPARPAAPPPGAMSGRRKLAMGLAAVVLVVAVAGLIALLLG